MNRLQTITQKVDRTVTGLNGSLFVHIEFTDAWAVDSIRFSQKSKDGNTMDTILSVLSDAATGIIQERRR